MNPKCLFILLTIFFSLPLFSQNEKDVNTIYNAGVKSEVQQIPLSAEIHPNPNKVKWAVTVKPTTSRSHGLPEVVALKESKLALKQASYIGGDYVPTKAVTPIVGESFQGTPMQFGTPPDNDIAISNGGIIVSVNNDKIEYYDDQGTLLYTEFWDDFIDIPALTSGIFDPKVIYDSEADRFILVVLHGSNASTSVILTCFSQTNDPQDGWNIYELEGNPLNDNSWLDYPSIGISNDELFITGNLFIENSGGFNQAFIYQISKTDGYDGNTLSMLNWSGLNNSPFNAFTLMPASYGHQGSHGPGMYFVSSRSSGSNRIRLWHINNNIDGNPQISVSNIFTTNYSAGADATQQGSTNLLDVGDCRIRDAFILGDLIHFIFSSDIGNGYSGINYNRLNYTTLSNTSNTFGMMNVQDFAYPSLESYATNVTDKSVMIGFLSASPTTYPEVRVVNCDDDFVFGNSELIKLGETFVDVFSSTTERWGDYTGMSRRHNAFSPTVWLTGCYGADITTTSDNRYRAWIAEINNPPTEAPNTDFVADVTTGIAPLTVNFTDLSTNHPSAWTWIINGGNPASSSQKNPSIVFDNPGDYTVILESSNSINSDIEEKILYINVLDEASVGVNERNNEKETLVYPNPVIDFFNIKFVAENYEKITVDLFNSKSQLVKLLYQGTPKQGENILHFNKNALTTGIYNLKISSDNKLIKNEKIIIN